MYRALLIMNVFVMNCRAMDSDLVAYSTPRTPRYKVLPRNSDAEKDDTKLFEVYCLEAALFSHISILRARMDEFGRMLQIKRQEKSFSLVLEKSESEIEKIIEAIVQGANEVRRCNLLSGLGCKDRIAQIQKDTGVIKKLHEHCAQKTAELQGYVRP